MPVYSYNATNPVTVGSATKKDHFDRAFENALAIKQGDTPLDVAAITGLLTANGGAQFGDTVLQRPEIKDAAESRTAPTISGGTLTLDYTTGHHFDVALNANVTTLTISNPPASGKAGGFVLKLTADGTPRTIAWPASVKWANGSAPTPTSTNNKVDMFTFITYDAGTTWYAGVIGQNF